MSYYSFHNDLSRSSSNSSTPSNQSFSTNARKRESWCDQTLKQSFLAEISEVEEFSSPRHSRSGFSRPRSRQSFHCDEDTPIYILPHVTSLLKHPVKIPKQSIPLSPFTLEKSILDYDPSPVENPSKKVKIDTPAFQINSEKKECLRTPSFLLKENNIGKSLSKGTIYGESIYRNYSKSSKLVENSILNKEKEYSVRSDNDSLMFNCMNKVKKLEFEETEIKPKVSIIEEKVPPIEPKNWNFKWIDTPENSPERSSENITETPSIFEKKIAEIKGLSETYNDFLCDLQKIKKRVFDFNNESKRIDGLQKLQKKLEKKEAQEIRSAKINVLKMKASEIPHNLRWRRHKVFDQHGQKVEIRNHVMTNSSCYSDNLIYKKFLMLGKIEINVYRGFYNNPKFNFIWGQFSEYVLKIVSVSDETKALFEISNFWLLFLKFERRVSRIEKIADDCEISADKFAVNLKGTLNSLPWQINFHFSRFNEKYSLFEMIFSQVS